MADDVAFDLPADEEEDDFFFMANLFPKDTGLTHAVWVSEKAGSPHDVRVKVSTAPGGHASPRNMAVMSVRPQSRLIHGNLPSEVVRDIARWITLNEQVILDYWTGEASTADLIHRLRKLDT